MMKIALVHDDLVQWGGAERMLYVLSQIFPQAPIYTSVYNPNHQLLSKYFKSDRVVTSFIQKIPGWRYLYKVLLPLYPLAFEQFDFSGFDLVISQTTRFAKSVITKPETIHICYCHTPPRFLWGFSGDKERWWMQPLLNLLRQYDRYSACRVDQWLAGSQNARDRIEKVYKQSSEVIWPCIDLSLFSSIESFNGDYLLVVSRLTEYKRVDLVIKAANKLKKNLKIIGSGPQEQFLQDLSGEGIEFLGVLDDATVRLVMSGCEALVVAGEEDFGLAALEAQALGKPVIAYKKGGNIETVVEGKSGYLFADQTVDSLILALNRLAEEGYNSEECFKQAQRFSKENFTRKFEQLVKQITK